MSDAIARLITRYSHVNWALADQAMVSGANFLTAILLARYLGIVGFGVFSLAWLVVGVVGGLQQSAVSQTMMSIGPKQEDTKLPSYYAAVFMQQAVFASVTSIFVLGGAAATSIVYPDWEIGPLVLPLVAATFAYQNQDFIRRYFFARGRIMAALGNDAVSYLGQLAALGWLFVVESLSPASALWAIAATSAAAALIGMLHLGPLDWGRADFSAVLKRHWRMARWLGGETLISLAAAVLFPATAGALLGPAAVGALKAAENLMGIAQVLLFALENVVPRRAAQHYHRSGIVALIRYLVRVASFGGAVTLCVTVFFALAPEFWLRVIFGEEYASYGNLVRWYVAISLLRFTGVPLAAGFRALEETRPMFLATCVHACISIAVAYPLISALGVTGVMIGMLIAGTAAAVLAINSFIRLARRAT